MEGKITRQKRSIDDRTQIGKIITMTIKEHTKMTTCYKKATVMKHQKKDKSMSDSKPRATRTNNIRTKTARM